MIDGPPSKHILACLRRVPCDRNPSVFLHKLLLTNNWKHCNVADIAQIGVNVFKTKILSEKSGEWTAIRTPVCNLHCKTQTVADQGLKTLQRITNQNSLLSISIASLHNVNDQFVTRWLSRNPHYMWQSNKYLWFFTSISFVAGQFKKKETV